MERQTIQRKVIIEAVKELEHSTLKDILKVCKEKFATISIATIYRNLEVLEKEGVIRRIPTKYKEDVYELTDYKPHNHFICKECHSIIDMPKSNLNTSFYNEYGDYIDEESVVYYGICVDCLENHKA